MLHEIRKNFFDIRRGEWAKTAGMAFFFFLVIAVFWVLKPMKRGLLINFYAEDPLYLLGLSLTGAEAEQIGKVLNMVAAYLVVVGFTLLIRHFPRQHIIYIFCAIFSLLFAAFAFFIGTPSSPVVWSFYIYGDMFNTVMVATFWAFTNDIVRVDQAKRLYGLIGLGGIVGGFVGATFVRVFVEEAGRVPLLVACIGAMLLITLVVYLISRRETASPHRFDASENGALSGHAALEGASLVFSSRYLMAILGIVGIYEIVSNIIDFQLALAVQAFIEGSVEKDAFFGLVGQLSAVGSILVQLLLTSFVMQRFGIKTALLFLPVAVLAGSAGFLVVPTLAFAAFMSASENSLNYSINQSAKEALYVPTTRDEKYKAKAFIDMFVQRFAKALAVVLNLAFAAFVGIAQMRWLSVASILLLLVWLIVVHYAGRRFHRLETTSPSARRMLSFQQTTASVEPDPKH